MHPFHNAVSFYYKKAVAIHRFDHRAIIAHACNNRFSAREMGQKLIEKPVFAQITKFHGEKISGNARAVKVSELKSECIVIATRMEPLHSYAIAKQLPSTNKGTNEGKCACAAANSSALETTPRNRPK